MVHTRLTSVMQSLDSFGKKSHTTSPYESFKLILELLILFQVFSNVNLISFYFQYFRFIIQIESTGF